MGKNLDNKIIFKIKSSNILFIFFFISFKYFLNRAKHSFKRISINAYNSCCSQTFNTCLPSSVSNQSNFSKVVTLVELKNFFRLFFGDQFSFSNHIKLVSFFSLLYNIISWVVSFFFQNITQLLFLIWINFR